MLPRALTKTWGNSQENMKLFQKPTFWRCRECLHNLEIEERSFSEAEIMKKKVNVFKKCEKEERKHNSQMINLEQICGI